MRTLFLALLSLSSFSAFAAEDWLCTEESSERRGNQVYACGVGQGPMESLARYNALLHAKREFYELCNISADCKDHKILAEAKRTSCLHRKGYKCYRLVVFTIQDQAIASTN